MIASAINTVFTAYTGPYGEGGWLELWRTTATGVPEKLSSFVTSNGDSNPLTVFNGLIYFRGQNGELWKTDGTPAGTQSIAGAAGVRDLTVVGGNLYFATGNGGIDNSSHLLKYDGVTVTSAADDTVHPDKLFVAGDALYFTGTVSLESGGGMPGGGSNPGPEVLSKIDSSGIVQTVNTTAASSDWTVLNPGTPAQVVGSAGALYSITPSNGFGTSSYVFRASTEHGVEQFQLQSNSGSGGPSPLYPEQLYVGNGAVYVLADQGFGNGRTLFVVGDDGSVATPVSSLGATVGGTPLLIDGLQPTVVDGVLYFAAHEQPSNNMMSGPPGGSGSLGISQPSPSELYKLDGNTLVQITGGNTGIGEPLTGISSNGHYYFTAGSSPATDLFREDANGPTLVAHLGEQGYTLGEILEADGKVFFTDTVVNGGASRLWVAPVGGSPTLLAGSASVGQISNLRFENGKLTFTAYDDVHGRELWTSDGTASGTAIQTDLTVGMDPSAAVKMDHTAAANGHFYYTTHDALGNESLWATNGSLGSTHEITLTGGFQVQPYTTLQAAGDAVYFYAWSTTDGNGFFKADQGGVALLGSNTSGLQSISDPKSVEGSLYFTAAVETSVAPDTITTFTELFRSNASGVTQVTHANGQYSPATYQLVEANGETYFVGLSNAGDHLYKVSGGAVTEVMNGSHRITSLANLTNEEGALYFTGDDGTGAGHQIFKSDATGVTQVSHLLDGILTNNIGVASGVVYYVDPHSSSVMKVVGNNTEQVSPSDVSAASHLTSIGGVLYFEAEDSSAIWQLYKVIGDASQQITGGSSGLSFGQDGESNHIFDVGGVPFFWAISGSDGNKIQLFKITGGAVSAVTGGATGFTEPSGFVVANGELYFKAFTQSTSELQIFKADAGGSVQLTSGPNNFDALQHDIFVSGGFVYYQASAGADGIELWKVNIAGGSAVPVTDTQSPKSSDPSNFTAVQAELDAPTGLAIDGYISGATVFADANRDGIWQSGEAKTTTDSGGHFHLTGGSGPLVLEGGVDTVTGLAFTGHLTAPSGYSVVTPLTTLINALTPANATASQIADAETAVLKAFNITLAPGQTIGTLDPEAGAQAANPDPASVAALVAGVQVQDTIVMLTSALQGAGLGDQASVTAAVVHALATKITAANGGLVNLANTTVVADTVGAAVALLDPNQTHTLVSGFSSDVADIVSASNTALNQSIALDPNHPLLHAGAAALVAQGATTSALSNPAGVQQAKTDYTGSNLTNAVDNAQLHVACFMAGTLIRTPDGEVPVEQLTRGDLVMTADGRAMPVEWLGRQTISRLFSDPLRVLPIRIRAGALGNNIPSRDLLTSPDHAFLVDDVLIQAGALVNNTTIIREADVPQIFTYYHVELGDHSLILAENAAAETFIDNVDRLGFDNWTEHQEIYPDGKPIVEMAYPRAKAHRQVPRAIRERLAEQAMGCESVRIVA